MSFYVDLDLDLDLDEEEEKKILLPRQRRRQRVQEQGPSLAPELELEGSPRRHPPRGIADDVLEAAELFRRFAAAALEQAEGESSDLARKVRSETDASARDAGSTRDSLLTFDAGIVGDRRGVCAGCSGWGCMRLDRRRRSH